MNPLFVFSLSNQFILKEVCFPCVQSTEYIQYIEYINYINAFPICFRTYPPQQPLGSIYIYVYIYSNGNIVRHVKPPHPTALFTRLTLQYGAEGPPALRQRESCRVPGPRAQEQLIHCNLCDTAHPRYVVGYLSHTGHVRTKEAGEVPV